jgi:WD40 repeat protein
VDKKVVITGIIGLILGGAAVMAFMGRNSSNKEIDDLKAQLSDLQRQEKRSAVMHSVSKQMEEIAYEQKKVSDEQREEAEEQTKVANEMRQRSEEERHNAIMAQQNAMASERKAIEAYDMAEHQREVAEDARRTAESLSYLALGRSLGAFATTQIRTGNKEIGNMLSYASYIFTERYHGDMYYPSVYQAITLASESVKEWNRHNGAIYNIEFMPKTDKQLVSVSNYGEILSHEVNGDQLKTTTLFQDKNYDFRDVLTNPSTGTIYAISRNGYLYIKNGNDVKFLEVPLVKPFKIQTSQDVRYLLLTGENNLALFDQTTQTIVATKELDYKVVLSARLEHSPLLFDDQGRMHIVKGMNNIETRKVPVSGQVTAFVSSDDSGLEAYGMKDGTIYICDKKGNVRKLVGHRSRISRIRIYQNRLFSSSYDGTINLWIVTNEKIEPITLYTSNNWILYFTYDRSKNYLWLGDQKGNLSQVLISVPIMVDRIKHKLKRNFTQDEWNYYIGEKIPYESFISPKGKEAKR